MAVAGLAAPHRSPPLHAAATTPSCPPAAAGRASSDTALANREVGHTAHRRGSAESALAAVLLAHRRDRSTTVRTHRVRCDRAPRQKRSPTGVVRFAPRPTRYAHAP